MAPAKRDVAQLIWHFAIGRRAGKSVLAVRRRQ
jgi:hypothetical protein